MAQSLWGGFRTIATGAISRAKEQIKEMTQENLQETSDDPNIRHLLDEIQRYETRNSKLKDLLNSKENEISQINSLLSASKEENSTLLTSNSDLNSKLLNLEEVSCI
jgi:hypothetical protein